MWMAWVVILFSLHAFSSFQIMGSSVSHRANFILPPSMHPGLGLVCAKKVQINWKCLIKEESLSEEKHALESHRYALYHVIDGIPPKAVTEQGTEELASLCIVSPVGHLAFVFRAVIGRPSAGTTVGHARATEASSPPPLLPKASALCLSGALLVVKDQHCECVCFIFNLWQTKTQKIRSKWITRKITKKKRQKKCKSQSIRRFNSNKITFPKMS